MITHLVVDLPPIPEHFYIDWLAKPVDQLPSQTINDVHTSQHYKNRITDRYGSKIKTNYQRRYDMGTEFVEWCKDKINCPSESSDLWYKDHGFTVNGLIGSTHCPHTDMRDWHLYYGLVTGGDDVTTCFWLENNCPLVRDYQTTPSSYDDLVLVDQVKFPVKTWILFNSRVLHSVENIQFPRYSIQVSMKSLPARFQKILLTTN